MVKQSQPHTLLRQLAYFACWFVLLCGAASAAAQYRYDVWTADNGLPQNIVRGIYQAPDGFLWISTFDGLVRFDGVHFVIFNKSNTPGIDSNRFGAMYGDPPGDLWLNTEGGGLTRYHNGVFKTFGTGQGLPAKTVRAITGDGAGHVWILNSDTIEAWNETRGRFVDITPPELKTRYEAFRWDNAGFWGWDEHGIHCFINGRFITYPMPQEISGPSIWVAAHDTSGAIWIETLDHRYVRIGSDGTASHSSTSASTTYVDGSGHSWTLQLGDELYRSLEYLNSGQTAAIQFDFLYEDRERNLWLGTEGQGLYRLQRQSISVYSKQQGLLDDNIYPIFEDHLGAMWIGAWTKGLSRFYNGRFTNFTVADGVPARLITAIYEDRDGLIWVAAHGGLSVYQDGRFRKVLEPAIPARTVVQAIFQDREGTLWFGTSNGLFSLKDHQTRLYTMKDGLAVDDARVIIETRAGDLWIGGYGGLTRIHNGQFTHWTEHDGLPSNNVRSLYEDSDGVLWIGTYDGGLGRLKNGKLTRITMRDGLFNNGVFQILEDARGNLWMSCNRGIYRASKQELNDFADGKRNAVTSVAYGKVDGMANVECDGGLWPAGAKAPNGKLWFPTQQGIAVIDPAAVSYNPQPPPVVIESLLIDRARPGVTGRPSAGPRWRGKPRNSIHSSQLHQTRADPFQVQAGGARLELDRRRVPPHRLLLPPAPWKLRLSRHRRQQRRRMEQRRKKTRNHRPRAFLRNLVVRVDCAHRSRCARRPRVEISCGTTRAGTGRAAGLLPAINRFTRGRAQAHRRRNARQPRSTPDRDKKSRSLSSAFQKERRRIVAARCFHCLIARAEDVEEPEQKNRD